ncbi:hypothetical protein ACWDRB_47660 [Nonomuraea sp. NPDC003707]
MALTQQRAIGRICTRIAPHTTEVQTDQLPLSGVQVWAKGAETAGSGAEWVLHQRMARQLARVGWHVEADEHRVLVLGWSAACLHHRVRLLQSALDRRLIDFGQTAVHALAYAAFLHARRTRPASHGAIIAAVCTSTRGQLRWPSELDDLDGFERTANIERVQLLLAQIVGLEAKVRQACHRHVLAARLLAGLLCDKIARNRDVQQAQHQVLTEARPWLAAMAAHRPSEPLPAVPGGPPASLTERLIGVVFPDPGGPATGSSPR